jgi:hypothetical protein
MSEKTNNSAYNGVLQKRNNDSIILRDIRFPNPISSSLTITRGNEAPADTELSLWSLDGRRIAQGSLGASDADYTFPTAHLPAGVYLLRVVSAGQIPQTYKIVKN